MIQFLVRIKESKIEKKNKNDRLQHNDNDSTAILIIRFRTPSRHFQLHRAGP